MKELIFIFLLFACRIDLSAQQGPGGVGNAGMIALWLSADNGVFNNAGSTSASNGDNVQQWNDRSGNASHAVQNTVGNRPNYFTGVINGLPVLRYTAANADLLMAAGVATANAASVWAAASYASLPSPNPGILIGSPSGSGINAAAGDKCIGMWVANTGLVWGRGVQSNSTSRDISQTTALSANTFYIINNIYRSNVINQYVNNASAGSNALFNGTLRSWTDVSVGRQGNESWNGDIAEIIIMNAEVNAAQRIIIDNYLAAKYNRVLATNDLYNEDEAVNGNFDHEVAGIGQTDASNIHDDSQGSGIVRILNPTNLGSGEFMFWGHNNLSLQAMNVTDIPASLQARMERVWRVSEVNTSGAAVNVGSVDLRWNLSALGPVTASDLRLLVDSDNDGLFSDETPISGATSLGAGIYEFAGVSALSDNLRFTLGTVNKSQTPLPVELIGFRLVCEDDYTINAFWMTATEMNCAEFELQRSADGQRWEQAGKLPGNGNSVTVKHYQCSDDRPYPGTSYYRLLQLDEDGTVKKFPPQYVSCKEDSHDLIIYPNPASGVIYIRGNIDQQIMLFGLSGCQLELDGRIRILSSGTIEMNISDLPSGFYLIRAGASNFKVLLSQE